MRPVVPTTPLRDVVLLQVGLDHLGHALRGPPWGRDGLLEPGGGCWEFCPPGRPGWWVEAGAEPRGLWPDAGTGR